MREPTLSVRDAWHKFSVSVAKQSKNENVSLIVHVADSWTGTHIRGFTIDMTPEQTEALIQELWEAMP